MLTGIRLRDLKEWCGGKSEATLDGLVSAISTDTRTISRGEVYLALKGEKFDGHAFIVEAAKRGCLAIISEKEVPLSIPVLVVDDSLKALIAIGRELRKRFKGKVCAVTGSAGKSSTKDAIATLLNGNTVKSPASYNNLIGVSKTMCLVESSTKQLVLEMGMNASGEIKELCETFLPEYGCITNIGDAHIGKLGGIDGIYRAKKEMFDYMAAQQAKGVALNLDDSKVVKAFAESLPKDFPTKTYSAEGKQADVSVVEKEINGDTGHLNLLLKVENAATRYSLPLFGIHHAQNIAAAVAMARLLGLSMKEIQARIPDIRPASHRGEIYSFGDSRTLIDESYNSNPAALQSSLKTLAAMNPSRRRVLVIGEMREMGEFGEKLHREVGETLVSLHQKTQFPFVLLGVGPLCRHLIEPVKQALPAIPCFQMETAKEAIAKLQTLLKSGDILFIKGSRGVGLDAVVKAFLKPSNPS